MSNFLNNFYSGINNSSTINATVLNTDMIDNTEFNTLDGVDKTKTIQQQFNALSTTLSGVSYDAVNDKTIIDNSLQLSKTLSTTTNQVTAASNDYITKRYLDTYYTGATGGSGVPGTAATVTIGTTMTLAPGSNATVTNSGSATSAILNFGIPQGMTGPQGVTGPIGLQGPEGPQGPQGQQGSEAASTLAAIAAAAAAAMSASSAAESAAAAAAAAGSSSNFEARVESLESKTSAQYHYNDVTGKNHTQFTDNIEVVNSTLASIIKVDANSQKIVTPNLWVSDIEALDSFSPINIGKNSNILVNIGNPITASTAFETTINLYGKVNFGFNTIIGTGLNQF